MGEDARFGDKVVTTRRNAMGAGIIGLAVTVTGCSGSGQSEQATVGSGETLAKTTDIPVGGGRILKDQKIVVTQPTAGEFKAFSAVCTHQGCIVGSVRNGVIDCPCHNSKFKVDDGSVTDGPAKGPLPAKKITVTGTDIKLA